MADINVVDIIIHVHPELSPEKRDEVVTALRDDEGVLSACFSPGHPHALTVAYNPDLIKSEAVLKHVRYWDQEAVMAGL